MGKADNYIYFTLGKRKTRAEDKQIVLDNPREGEREEREREKERVRK